MNICSSHSGSRVLISSTRMGAKCSRRRSEAQWELVDAHSDGDSVYDKDWILNSRAPQSLEALERAADAAQKRLDDWREAQRVANAPSAHRKGISERDKLEFDMLNERRLKYPLKYGNPRENAYGEIEYDVMIDDRKPYAMSTRAYKGSSDDESLPPLEDIPQAKRVPTVALKDKDLKRKWTGKKPPMICRGFLRQDCKDPKCPYPHRLREPGETVTIVDPRDGSETYFAVRHKKATALSQSSDDSTPSDPCGSVKIPPNRAAKAKAKAKVTSYHQMLSAKSTAINFGCERYISLCVVHRAELLGCNTTRWRHLMVRLSWRHDIGDTGVSYDWPNERAECNWHRMICTTMFNIRRLKRLFSAAGYILQHRNLTCMASNHDKDESWAARRSCIAKRSQQQQALKKPKSGK